jgi:general secretion pathway protein G
MLIRQQQPQRRRPAFTLMEMLVVVAIIVMLAGIGTYYYIGQAEQSRKDTAKMKIRELQTAVETYNVQHRGQWPESLESLLQKDDSGLGPYLKSQEALLDPWDRPFQYDPAGTRNNSLTPDIWTQAPDGKEIGNWPGGSR